MGRAGGGRPATVAWEGHFTSLIISFYICIMVSRGTEFARALGNYPHISFFIFPSITGSFFILSGKLSRPSEPRSFVWGGFSNHLRSTPPGHVFALILLLADPCHCPRPNS